MAPIREAAHKEVPPFRPSRCYSPAAPPDTLAACLVGQMNPLFRSFILTALAICIASAAQAHPHVWVTMKSELVYAPDGKATGVRHAWTFDDMFSTFATQG